MLSVETQEALLLSIRVAGCAVLLMLGPAIALGWLLARRQFVGKALLNALVHIPLVVPPVVTGYVLLLLLGQRGWIGAWLHQHWGLQMSFSWMAAVMASAVMAFPLMVRSIRLAIELVDPKLEQAAGTLGLRPWSVFVRATCPLAAGGIVSGMVLAFARSLGEFGATITFAGNIAGRTQTLPLAIYSALQQPNGNQQAGTLVMISICLSLVAMFVAEILSRRALRRLRA